MMIQKRKGLVEYRKWKPEGEFIHFRDYTGGRGSGFPKTGAITLHEALMQKNPDYDEIIVRMKEQLLVVLKAFYDEGILTANDIKAIVP
jgi:hypothetical protein